METLKYVKIVLKNNSDCTWLHTTTEYSTVHPVHNCNTCTYCTVAQMGGGGVWSSWDPTVWGLLRIDLNHVSGFRQIGLKLQHF